VSRWIVRRGSGAARARVICISRAGGTARDFDAWPAMLGEEIELCAVQLPGRLERFREPALHDLREIAAAVADAITELPPLPYLLFGDCMGALIAYEDRSDRCPFHRGLDRLAVDRLNTHFLTCEDLKIARDDEPKGCFHLQHH
jgi:hypothetical protein